MSKTLVQNGKSYWASKTFNKYRERLWTLQDLEYKMQELMVKGEREKVGEESWMIYEFTENIVGDMTRFDSVEKR